MMKVIPGVLFPVLTAIMLAPSAPAAPESPAGLQADHAKAGTASVIQLKLGQPFGTMITIEGARVTINFKADADRVVFSVSSVNGLALPEPQLIPLRFFGFTPVKPPALGEKTTFRGYEAGGFEGLPESALQEMKTIPATTGWHFQHYFQVVKEGS